MKKTSSMILLVVALMLGTAVTVLAQSVAPPFDADYTVVDLGSATGVPANLNS